VIFGAILKDFADLVGAHRDYPLVLKLFPNPATKPPQQEMLIEFYRKGKVDEAVRAFKKTYLEVVHQIVDHLETGESSSGGYKVLVKWTRRRRHVTSCRLNCHWPPEGLRHSPFG